jgi:hypothetical protein
MREVVTILKYLIDNLPRTIDITSITDNLNGTFKLNTCNTLYARALYTITIGATTYTIKAVEINKSITIESADPIVATIGTLQNIGFHSGTLMDIDNERGSAKRVNQEITPFVWNKEPFRITLNKSYDRPEYGSADITLYVMGECDPQNMLTDNHRHEVIYPMENYAITLLNYINERVDLFYNLEDVRMVEMVNVGSSGKNGNIERLFDENLSGVEMNFTLKMRQKCKKCLT